MPKSREQKNDTLKKLKTVFEQAKAVVFANFKGMKVSEITKVRRESKKSQSEFIVAKKTLFRKALSESGLEGIDVKAMDGQVSIIASQGDEIAPAKIAAKYAKGENFSILGGIMEKKFIDSEQIKALSALPNREGLLAQLVGTMNAPISGLVNVLAGNIRGLVTVLNALKDKK